MPYSFSSKHNCHSSLVTRQNPVFERKLSLYGCARLEVRLPEICSWSGAPSMSHSSSHWVSSI